jgi:hypothetical protein
MGQRTLDFAQVSREIRSLVSRRRDLMMFLGTLFAAMGVYLENVLEGKLPTALARLEQRAFLTYSAAVLIPTVIIALRLAKMHAGMIINGTLYARILRDSVRPDADPARATRLNWGGFSTQLFLLASLIAGVEATLLCLASGIEAWSALGAGATGFVVLTVLFLRFHSQAAGLAMKLAETALVEAVDREEVEDHLAGSLQDSNQDMLSCIAFVGLILFSVLESLSGLRAVTGRLDIPIQHVQQYGPNVYSFIAITTSAIGAIIYLRLAVAAGRLSLELDPTDRPFRPFKLTDTFLGYWLLAFFLTVSIHLMCFPVFGDIAQLWVFDGAALGVAVAVYPVTIMLAARAHRAAAPPEKS